MLRSLVLPALLVASGLCVAAEPSGTARGLVERGLAAYLKGGATDAIKTWIRGSALEGNTQATTQANSLRQIEDFYGKPQGITVLKEATIAPRVKTIYFTINYEKGVAFSRFNEYQKTDGTWIVTSFLFHTEASQVFPTSLLGD